MASNKPHPPIEHERVSEPDFPLVHDRTYSVRAYRKSPKELLIRGQIRDQKPPGVYIDHDTEPLTVHHMVVDIEVQFPELLITNAAVVMETHPHTSCTTITEHYEKLVGMSIARGFSRQIRELFGGPRGCTHTTALLQAMAPVAVQSIWGMESFEPEEGTPVRTPLPSNPTDEQIRERFAFNINTCHVWREDGPTIEGIKNGEAMEPPLWIVDRFKELGLDPAEWDSRFG